MVAAVGAIMQGEPEGKRCMRRRWNPFDRRRSELRDEIQAHLQMAIQDRRDRGESPEDARAGALRELGNPALVGDVTREAWGWLWLERLAQRRANTHFDSYVRLLGSRLRRVATLALGLGATIAMFTVVDRVLLRPLPYRDAHQLVEIKEAGRKDAIDWGEPFLDLEQWRQRGHTLSGIAYYEVSELAWATWSFWRAVTRRNWWLRPLSVATYLRHSG